MRLKCYKVARMSYISQVGQSWECIGFSKEQAVFWKAIKLIEIPTNSTAVAEGDETDIEQMKKIIVANENVNFAVIREDGFVLY